MRIAWFIHRYAPVVGGSENFARAMVSRFVARGDQVDVYTSDAWELSRFTRRSGRKVDLPTFSSVDDAKVHRFAPYHLPAQRYIGKLLSYLPAWKIQCNVGSYLPIIPQLNRVESRYDLTVGVAFPYTNFSYAAWRLAQRSACPFVVIPFLHLGSAGYTRPHQIKLLKQADLILAVTKLEADTLVRFGIDPSKIDVLPMAFDKDKVTGGDRLRLREHLGICDGTTVIGQVGALDYNKGTEHLVEAVDRLNRAASQPIHLILAGLPTSGFLRFLEARSSQNLGWLHVLGPFDDAILPDLYAALDIYAMPSRTDSFGIVFLEAWANGKPVVAADAGGVAEVVRHEVDGLLIPFCDVARLEHALERLITDKAYAHALGESGQSRVATGWTWDDRFAQLRDRITQI